MKSLREQLLKVGLADKQAVKNARKQKLPKQPKKARGQASESARLADQALRDKADRDKALNRQRQQQVETKAGLAQIKQLIEGSKLGREEGELAYNFTVGGRIKTLHVTAEQHQQLIRNQIAIVALSVDSFELVPKVVAEKIAQRDRSYIVENAAGANSDFAEDDPYANYQIPDDLIW